jgi:hypothetical protein
MTRTSGRSIAGVQALGQDLHATGPWCSTPSARSAIIVGMDRTPAFDTFRAGYAAVEAALEGITEAELDRRPADGSWTAREVVHHLADSEAMAYIRLRRLIAEDNPTIQGYDEPVWAQRLHYGRPIAASLAVLAGVRAASLELLESLSEAEFAREGTHSESGRYTVEGWLRIYTRHAAEHADQIRRARTGQA